MNLLVTMHVCPCMLACTQLLESNTCKYTLAVKLVQILHTSFQARWKSRMSTKIACQLSCLVHTLCHGKASNKVVITPIYLELSVSMLPADQSAINLSNPPALCPHQEPFAGEIPTKRHVDSRVSSGRLNLATGGRTRLRRTPG